jgi:hypothetical protein
MSVIFASHLWTIFRNATYCASSQHRQELCCKTDNQNNLLPAKFVNHLAIDWTTAAKILIIPIRITSTIVDLQSTLFCKQSLESVVFTHYVLTLCNWIQLYAGKHGPYAIKFTDNVHLKMLRLHLEQSP